MKKLSQDFYDFQGLKNLRQWIVKGSIGNQEMLKRKLRKAHGMSCIKKSKFMPQYSTMGNHKNHGKFYTHFQNSQITTPLDSKPPYLGGALVIWDQTGMCTSSGVFLSVTDYPYQHALSHFQISKFRRSICETREFR